MICPPCRDANHEDCPELERQERLAGALGAEANHLCACQHKTADGMSVLNALADACFPVREEVQT